MRRDDWMCSYCRNRSAVPLGVPSPGQDGFRSLNLGIPWLRLSGLRHCMVPEIQQSLVEAIDGPLASGTAVTAHC